MISDPDHTSLLLSCATRAIQASRRPRPRRGSASDRVRTSVRALHRRAAASTSSGSRRPTSRTSTCRSSSRSSTSSTAPTVVPRGERGAASGSAANGTSAATSRRRRASSSRTTAGRDQVVQHFRVEPERCSARAPDAGLRAATPRDETPLPRGRVDAARRRRAATSSIRRSSGRTRTTRRCSTPLRARPRGGSRTSSCSSAPTRAAASTSRQLARERGVDGARALSRLRREPTISSRSTSTRTRSPT